jgi:anti-sigma factor RsiW
MNCIETRQVIDAYVDEALDASTRLDLTEHLAACTDCARLHAERNALSQRLRAVLPRYLAPAKLRRRLERIDSDAPRVAAARVRAPSWPQTIGAMVIVAVVCIAIGYELGRPSNVDSFADLIVANHVASLAQNGVLTDIASSDRHTVKPWLQGKIDFAPTVIDLSARGYALVGARLGTLRSQQAVAIVYKIRNHYINVYAWRAPNSAAPEPVVTQARGFGLVTWSNGGLSYAAISDIDARELREFTMLLR